MRRTVRVIGTIAVLDVAGLDAMLARLRSDGFRVIGPVVGDGAVLYGDVSSVDDLPAGTSDDQDAGRYRLVTGDGVALFAHGPGPQSWKRFLHPPRELQWRATRTDDDGAGAVTFDVEAAGPPAEPPFAFVGVRACDLAAIDTLDRVMLADPQYAARRGQVFVVAVACTAPGGTCFCDSMGTGPRPVAGYDLLLTELVEPDRHLFIAETGSSRGADVLDAIPHREATATDVAASDMVVARARASMGRTLDTVGLRERLLASLEDPHWDDVAARCLGCANCTLVCPTCFCTTTEDTTGLDLDVAERWRRWDSCFTLGHSYIHGGSIRTSTRSRYRQWLTHKLATWFDQFGTSGCVGCGRCITWCPAGIDLTVEAAAVARGNQ